MVSHNTKRDDFVQIAAYTPAGLSIHRADSHITHTFYLRDIRTESLTRENTPIHDVAVVVITACLPPNGMHDITTDFLTRSVHIIPERLLKSPLLPSVCTPTSISARISNVYSKIKHT